MFHDVRQMVIDRSISIGGMLRVRNSRGRYENFSGSEIVFVVVFVSVADNDDVFSGGAICGAGCGGRCTDDRSNAGCSDLRTLLELHEVSPRNSPSSLLPSSSLI